MSATPAGPGRPAQLPGDAATATHGRRARLRAAAAARGVPLATPFPLLWAVWVALARGSTRRASLPPWPRRGQYSRADDTRGQDRFDRPSGAGYFGHNAGGLRPARKGTFDPLQAWCPTGGLVP